MGKIDILDRIKNYHTISIIGMDKNVGKTTALNYILDKTRNNITLGLTSIGRDGEEEDRVTETKKPKIYIKRDTYLATSKQCLFNGDITKEILETTNINTPMGEVIIAKALSDGFVELGGPSINAYMKQICDRLKTYGCEKIIVDGALSRKTTASPSVTEAAILSTGASLNKSMSKVVEKTAHAVSLLSIAAEESKAIINIVEKELSKARIGIVYKDLRIRDLKAQTSLEGAKEIVDNLGDGVSHVLIRGVVTDKLIEDIIKSTDKYKGITFLVEDGTKLFINKDTLYRLLKLGGVIKSLESINLTCLTCNPKSPFGYEFNKDLFLETLQKNIALPVFDLMG
ncbi:hypothetical protein [Candidatus Clostridium stratigraminis]|uniref:Uncharacterized protein n=1 Tax=Candidatus Clostridium stratigraminis TaxID=3381661 RepID=A0ABW8T9G3_9CLOT